MDLIYFCVIKNVLYPNFSITKKFEFFCFSEIFRFSYFSKFFIVKKKIVTKRKKKKEVIKNK